MLEKLDVSEVWKQCIGRRLDGEAGPERVASTILLIAGFQCCAAA